MTKNDGPKKRARDLAKKLNLPLSEAKQHLARSGPQSQYRDSAPGPIMLKVRPEHQGYLWDRGDHRHLAIEVVANAGGSRLCELIAKEALSMGDRVIWAPTVVREPTEPGVRLPEVFRSEQHVEFAERLNSLIARTQRRTVVIIDDASRWDGKVESALLDIMARQNLEVNVVLTAASFDAKGPGVAGRVVMRSGPASIAGSDGTYEPHRQDFGIPVLDASAAIVADSPQERVMGVILSSAGFLQGLPLTQSPATERVVSFAANHAENLTLATPSGRTRPTDRPVSAPVAFLPDDEAQFHGDRFWWTVQAVGEQGTLVLTRKAAFGEGGVYTIVHWGRGWRGPHDSWGHPAETREECQEVAAAIDAGEDFLGMSVRNSVYLDLKKVRRGNLTVWADEAPAA